MYIMAVFEYTTHLELALHKLLNSGLDEKQVIAVPLDIREEEPLFFDTIHVSDGKSLLDFPIFMGTIFGLLGSVYGFVLEWGPIIWGIIGFFSGGLAGLLFDVLHHRRQQKRRKVKLEKYPEVVLTIECKEEQRKEVEKILWRHYALGIGMLEK